MKNLLFFVLFLFFFPASFTTQKHNAQDTVLLELKKIRESNNLLRIKDSIRSALLQEELGSMHNPKSAELKKYRSELQHIRTEDSLRIAEQKKNIDALRKKVQPYPVQLFHKTLFTIYSGLGPFSAQQRAGNAQEQIKKLYNDKLFFPDSLKIQPKYEYINLTYNGRVVMSVSEEDALWANVSQDSLAAQYSKIISANIQESRKSHEFENTLQRWLLAFGIVIGFLLVTFLMRKIISMFTRKIIKINENDIRSMHIRQYKLISPRQIRVFLIRTLKWIHIALYLFCLYISLSLIFSIFPATEHWAYRLLHWIWIPVKDMAISLYHYFPNLLKMMVILILGRYVDKLLRFLSVEIEKGNLRIRNFYKEWAQPTYHIVRICLIAFVIIMIFPYLPGSDTSAFRGISVFFGVLLSLGSSTAIANTIAGFIITYMRPFKEGDWIKISDVTGEVIEKSALVTRLRTINNEDITVPNSMILTNKTINYSSSTPEKGLIIPINIHVKFDVPFQKVNDLLIKAALMTEGILETPAPYVLKNAILETNVFYQLNAFTYQPQRMYYITSDLNQNILKVFSEAGIDLVTPQYFSVPDQN